MPRLSLFAALLIATVALSTAAPFFRVAHTTHPMAAAAARLAIASLILLPFVWPRLKARLRSTPSDPSQRPFWIAAVVAGLFYALHFGTWVGSLQLTSVAASVTLVTATPLFLALWALFSGIDRPHRQTWIALALSAVGIAIIGGHSIGTSASQLLGDGLALLGAVAMAAYLLVARRLGPNLDVFAFLTVAAAVGAACLYLACLITGVHPFPDSRSDLLFLAGAALIPQVIGHGLLTWALRHITPTAVGITTLGEPVGATLLAWWWLGDTLSAPVLAGCAITLFGVAFAIGRRAPD